MLLPTIIDGRLPLRHSFADSLETLPSQQGNIRALGTCMGPFQDLPPGFQSARPGFDYNIRYSRRRQFDQRGVKVWFPAVTISTVVLVGERLVGGKGVWIALVTGPWLAGPGIVKEGF